MQPLKSAKKKSGGIADWLGRLHLAKSPAGTTSWYQKQTVSGSGAGYDAGEAYTTGSKFDIGSIWDKLTNAKG